MLNPSVSLPYRDESGIKGKYLYAIGGYHSTDTGCPAWLLWAARFISPEAGSRPILRL